MSIKYRPEIDGLRAIAVIAVVLYHAEFVFRGINPFKGGFIGVDVFFVISGYLITSIILGEMQEDRFSFARFYERRARRILPALFVVMAASIPFAWMYMLPKAMKDYAGSVISALAFGSNIWFWQEDSYTTELSAFKPFLHTWSLSVEEQFYVLFPLFLLLLWKFARGYITSLFVVVFFLSLQLAHIGSGQYVDATFYLLPTRGWELLAGAILAKLEISKGRISHPFLDMFMPALGLFLICNAFVFFDDQMRHPSFNTLQPVIGTMLLVWFCKKGELISDFLRSKPFVAIGLISYSFYLWHFPIFAFARINNPTLSDYDKVECILLALFLSIAIFFVIEKPMRNPTRVKLNRFSYFAATSVLILLAFNYLAFSLQITSKFGYEYPVALSLIEDSNATVTTQKWVKCRNIKIPNGTCHQTGHGTELTIIWGDSHANALRKGIVPNNNETLMVITNIGCPPIIDIRRYDGITNAKNCDNTKILKENAELISSLQPKRVLLVSRWTLYIHGWHRENKLQKAHCFITSSNENPINPSPALSTKTLRTNLHKTVNFLSETSEVVFISQPPDMQSLGVKAIQSGNAVTLPKDVYLSWHSEEKKIMQELKQLEGIRVINLENVFCHKNACITRIGDDAASLVYSDDNHLSGLGAQLAWQYIQNQLQ